ncbi:hypothetical protein LZ30DRAFT_299551 [Colletotrichum cereale]|nr:hypothetical protein LZ30DRAFT_299551 [Colletotrichum cereale]
MPASSDRIKLSKHMAPTTKDFQSRQLCPQTLHPVAPTHVSKLARQACNTWTRILRSVVIPTRLPFWADPSALTSAVCAGPGDPLAENPPRASRSRAVCKTVDRAGLFIRPWTNVNLTVRATEFLHSPWGIVLFGAIVCMIVPKRQSWLQRLRLRQKEVAEERRRGPARLVCFFAVIFSRGLREQGAEQMNPQVHGPSAPLPSLQPEEPLSTDGEFTPSLVPGCRPAPCFLAPSPGCCSARGPLPSDTGR